MFLSHENQVFLKGFFENWKEVGTPWPSSPRVARKVCDAIDFEDVRTIVEIGPGTGIITRQILMSLRRGATLTVFEVNKEFCDELESIGSPSLTVHNISGFEMHTVLPLEVDCVVSGIPIATLAKPEFFRYYQEIKRILRPTGTCVQLQLSPISYGKLKLFFNEVKVDFTLRNAPPAFVYSCRDL